MINAAKRALAATWERLRSLNISDALSLVALIVALFALLDSMHHTKIASETFGLFLKASQYQNSIALIDQSSEVIDGLRKQPRFLRVLEGTNTKTEDLANIGTSLEVYQSLLFKASLLTDQNLVPKTIWEKFVDDFCSFYRQYAFIKGWWGNQRYRQPYASLSSTYTNLSHECETRGAI